MSKLSFLAGAGEMRERIRSFPWDRSPLGPAEEWPPTLKAMVRMALGTRHPIFIFWGVDSICLYNDAYRESLGPEKHPTILGLPGRQAWPEIWPIIRPQIEMVMRGDGATWHENQLVPILRNGRVEDVYWTYSYGPIDDADAEHGVGGVLVICTETTQQVLSERRAVLERQRFSELFAQAPSFIAVLRGPQHVFDMVNPRYAQLIAHRPVLGKSVAEALPEAVEQGYVALLDQVYRSGVPFSTFDARFELHSAPGGPAQEMFLDFVYQPMRDPGGTITGVFVEGVDVTERHRVETRLREAENRLLLAMESSSLGTFDLTMDTGRIRLSERAQALFEVDQPEVALADCLARIPPEDRPRVEAAIATAMAAGSDGRYQVRHRVLLNNGSIRWLSAAGRIERDHRAGGIGNCLTGMLWDVTEQQQLMESLQKSDRRKDEFLATLAHELRNPLAPIRAAASMLALPDLAPGQIADCARVIQRQSRTMALLLDDLLDVSRITSGKLELRPMPVAVEPLVEAAVEAARPTIDDKRHDLHVHLPESPQWLHADPLRIAQVLTNLLTNAAKYTDAGGRIRLDVRRRGDSVEFEVSDNGIGFGVDERERLFEMFHQSEGTKSRAQGGLGIGLALSRRLVEFHGGCIEARSSGAGLGATFKVTLPASMPGAAPAESSTLALPSSSAQPALVLVADDNVDAATTMAMLLEISGYRVVVAHDGLRARDAAVATRPAAALLDIGMPGLSGYELAAALRNLAGGRDMLLVAMTGWGQSEDKQQALAAGFDEHLTKPVQPEAVLQLLAERLPGRKATAGRIGRPEDDTVR